MTRDGGKRAAADLVDRPEVTGCVCYSDRVAFGVMTGLTNLGIRVGRDFAVVGMDNLPESESSVPPLTTVSVQSRAIGRRAGDLIIRRIKGPTEVAEMVIIEPELVIREIDLSAADPRAGRGGTARLTRTSPGEERLSRFREPPVAGCGTTPPAFGCAASSCSER